MFVSFFIPVTNCYYSFDLNEKRVPKWHPFIHLINSFVGLNAKPFFTN
jgi:hypothetical protein